MRCAGAGLLALVGLGIGGCSFDTISIGITDPNEDDGFGGYVPAHERARWEMPVWEKADDEGDGDGQKTDGAGGGA